MSDSARQRLPPAIAASVVNWVRVVSAMRDVAPRVKSVTHCYGRSENERSFEGDCEKSKQPEHD